MKRLLTIVMVIIAVGITIGMGAMPDKEKQFRFEDYDKAEDAQAALLSLYPIGSNVASLIKTLKIAGSKCF